MKTMPLTKAQVAQLPVGHGYAPQFLNRRDRRAMERKNPRLKRLFDSMAKAQTLDVNVALDAEKVKTIVQEAFDETKSEMPIHMNKAAEAKLQEVIKEQVEKL